MVLCTDDTIFGTRLSMEYALAAQTFGLTRHELADLALSAADMAFLHAGQRAEMKGRMEAAVHTLLNSTPCETTRPNGMNN